MKKYFGSCITNGSEVYMYARVWRVGILAGKIEEFTSALNAMKPLLDKQPGFCGLLGLRSGPGALETTVISLWASIDDLRNSEGPVFQQAALTILSFCEPHPFVREEEVVLSDFTAHSFASAATVF
jgi:heme-degrading monooxygenase HmoA